MKIIDALLAYAELHLVEGGVLADSFQGEIVRLWTLDGPFKDGRKMRALRRFFPHLQVLKNGLIRLGGYYFLAEANAALAKAKMESYSTTVQDLHRFDTEESLATLVPAIIAPAN